jgi:peptide-methionine (R)-S-oxide reductase
MSDSSTNTSTRRAALGMIGLGSAGLVALRWPTPAEARQFAVRRSEAEWRRLLGPERFRILRQAGTERAFSSPLDKEKRKGLFRCAGCSLPLFASATKFDSGTG